MHVHPHPAGFTVLELLVTLTIAAVLLITGLPSLQAFSDRQRMKAAVGTLHNDLLLARSEAVFRGMEVIACPGGRAEGCADSSDWSGGWIVFGDANGDRERQSGEAVLRHGQWFQRLRITGSAGRTQIRFFPDGSAPGSNGSIWFCGMDGPAQARRLVISNAGRIRRDLGPDIDPVLCPAG
jgi:type IV fimbrial biogenesis protein FimT